MSEQPGRQKEPLPDWLFVSPNKKYSPEEIDEIIRDPYRFAGLIEQQRKRSADEAMPQVRALLKAGWQFEIVHENAAEPWQWAFRSPSKRKGKPGRRYASTQQAYNALLKTQELRKETIMVVYFDQNCEEAWFKIPGLELYDISSKFRVRTWKKMGPPYGIADEPRIVKVSKNDSGYFRFAVHGPKQKVVYIHQVVAALMYGDCPLGMEVLHYDDDKTNNHPSNLRYGTRVENQSDAKRNGIHTQGINSPSAKLNSYQIRVIRRLRGKDDLTDKQIGEFFKVSPNTILRAARGITYRQ